MQRRDTEAQARQALALALVDEMAVLGCAEVRYRWSARGYGLDRMVASKMTLELEPPGLAGDVIGTIVPAQPSPGCCGGA